MRDDRFQDLIFPESAHRADPPPSARPRGRVLFLASTFPRWEGDSSAPFVLNLAQDLQALGWQVDALVPHAPGALTSDEIGGVRVDRFRYLWPETLQTVCYGGGALANLRRDRGNLVKLPALVAAETAAVARRLAGGRYDLLHSHWILPQGFVGTLTAGPLGVPHVTTVHGSDVFALRGRWLAHCKRFALKHADRVTVNSRATEDAVRGLAPGLADLRLIPMGVSEQAPDAEAIAALRARYRRGAGPLVAFVGRLVEDKGVADLVQAVALLSRRIPDVTAVIAGEGPERVALEALAYNLGIADRVAFPGWLGEGQVASVLAAADIFAGPSRRGRDGTTEAQGLVFAEALLAGTPVIASRLGGIVDLVRHEETGLLVDEAAPEQIAAAVERLSADPGLARRLTARGRRTVEEGFTRSVSAQAFSDLYDDLARAGNRPGVAREDLSAGQTT